MRKLAYELADRLALQHTLTLEEYCTLLEQADAQVAAYLAALATFTNPTTPKTPHLTGTLVAASSSRGAEHKLINSKLQYQAVTSL